MKRKLWGGQRQAKGTREGVCAKEIQELFLAGKKDAAEAAIPDSYLAANSLVGEPEFVTDRLHALKESGVTSLNVGFMGETTAERVKACDQLRNLVDTM